MIESYTLSMDGRRYFHQIDRTPLPYSIDFLPFLNAQEDFPKCYWQSADGSFEAIAWGSLLTFASPPTFALDSDSPARFWGGHAFFPFSNSKDTLWKSFPRSVFFLPKYELIRRNDSCELLVHGLNHSPLNPPLLKPYFFESETYSSRDPKHLPSKEEWKETLSIALKKIEQKIFEKVVMARRTSFTFKTGINGYQLLSKLNVPKATRFAFQFTHEQLFIGATPEKLFSRKGRSLVTEAVAGTRPRGKTVEEDLFLEKDLMENKKEENEFNLVKTSIKNGLSPLCEKIVEKEERVLKMPNVQHRHTLYAADLLSGVGDGELLGALHPSAAVGGLPRSRSLHHLLGGEPFERGWYSSPIGYTSKEESEFAIGIRSALVEKKELHLFAGVGIVEGSHHEKEWEELNDKMSLWEKHLK